MADAEAACRAKELRLTPIRRRVLEIVWNSHAPTKAYAILDELALSGRRAAPPTVYRALEFLLDAGLIHRLDSRNAFTGCGAPARPHAGQFLICRGCDTVAELDDQAIRETLVREAGYLGFRVVPAAVEIQGLCPACAGS